MTTTGSSPTRVVPIPAPGGNRGPTPRRRICTTPPIFPRRLLERISGECSIICESLDCHPEVLRRILLTRSSWLDASEYLSMTVRAFRTLPTLHRASPRRIFHRDPLHSAHACTEIRSRECPADGGIHARRTTRAG